MAQATRHPEVNEENPTALESNNQILAPALERGDPLAGELGGDGGGVERPRQPLVEDLGLLDRAADELSLQSGPDRLDFGELRHA